MNKPKLRSKRVIIATTATVAALAIGGGAWATAANADADTVTGNDRTRVADAAVQAVGDGTATDVETSDDEGEAYEVEVRKQDGTEVDVTLDKNLKVISQETDTPDAAAAPAVPSSAAAPDAGDRALTDAERAAAEKAILAAVPGGTITDLEPGDAPAAYEAEVRATDGADWDITLDPAYKILTKTADN
ncbi:PepSY domain-containing protein [Actinoplanes sp. RD1]|uniref:PepSY domain-containing protein n=1 Tax=Actinoplanes sp. RD1 TaxID=3064538 RepID=UPI0027416E1F|nr:PepSY domain-containing protein [Actinoplanes sp. RD1]